MKNLKDMNKEEMITEYKRIEKILKEKKINSDERFNLEFRNNKIRKRLYRHYGIEI
jgi:hypothetical protein